MTLYAVDMYECGGGWLEMDGFFYTRTSAEKYARYLSVAYGTDVRIRPLLPELCLPPLRWQEVGF